jgi:hypothetical protein
MLYHLNQRVLTGLGWGIVIECHNYGTSGNFYIVQFPNGMINNFPENQLCLS